jgi:hypothetical protein
MSENWLEWICVSLAFGVALSTIYRFDIFDKLAFLHYFLCLRLSPDFLTIFT